MRPLFCNTLKTSSVAWVARSTRPTLTPQTIARFECYCYLRRRVDFKFCHQIINLYFTGIRACNGRFSNECSHSRLVFFIDSVSIECIQHGDDIFCVLQCISFQVVWCAIHHGFSERDRMFIIRQPTKGENHDYDNKNSQIDLRLTPQSETEIEGKEEEERWETYTKTHSDSNVF